MPIPTTAEGSFLEKFFEATKDLGAAERGAYLEHPPSGGVDIEEAHQVCEGLTCGCGWVADVWLGTESVEAAH
jgi:hypothetical protein